MAQPTIDPTFYRTAAEAAAAPVEQLAYVVAFDRAAQKNDAMTVVDVNPASDSYGRVVGWTDVPGLGNELHHFGWNACSSALKHEGHNMDGLARRCRRSTEHRREVREKIGIHRNSRRHAQCQETHRRDAQ